MYCKGNFRAPGRFLRHSGLWLLSTKGNFRAPGRFLRHSGLSLLFTKGNFRAQMNAPEGVQGFDTTAYLMTTSIARYHIYHSCKSYRNFRYNIIIYRNTKHRTSNENEPRVREGWGGITYAWYAWCMVGRGEMHRKRSVAYLIGRFDIDGRSGGKRHYMWCWVSYQMFRGTRYCLSKHILTKFDISAVDRRSCR